MAGVVTPFASYNTMEGKATAVVLEEALRILQLVSWSKGCDEDLKIETKLVDLVLLVAPGLALTRMASAIHAWQ